MRGVPNIEELEYGLLEDCYQCGGAGEDPNPGYWFCQWCYGTGKLKYVDWNPVVGARESSTITDWKKYKKANIKYQKGKRPPWIL